MESVDSLYMREALCEARAAFDIGEIPVGALIVKGGQVLSRAHNTRETCRDPLGHAEMTAIKRAAEVIGDWRLEGCTLYVTLEPCPMCAGALLEARVERVVFGAHDEKIGAVGSVLNIADYPGLGRTVRVKAGVLEGECRMVLERFFRERLRASRAHEGEMAEPG
ncbi:MAG: tRNA adenosine(34) deaminase TadA [Candidatus Eremiobacteraeota bacterium]|nr:tRNA adenosine(34) deaminase TadA [Candidatus Eremiobacteraeota bacterium]